MGEADGSSVIASILSGGAGLADRVGPGPSPVSVDRLVAAMAAAEPLFSLDLGDAPPFPGFTGPDGSSSAADPVRESARASRAGSAADALHRSEDAIARSERDVRAWACLDLDAARDAATTTGPLAATTVGVKDLIDVAGLPTRAGSRHPAPTVEVDAPAVGALRSAGALVLGKTTTDEFALGGTCPPTRNPWSLDRIPGGSSGGSAAAVAAGHCDVALGTDTAGSVRIPSSFCGVVGLKPTTGLVPRDRTRVLAWSLDTVGVIGANVGLVAATHDVLAGRAGDEDRQVPRSGGRLDGVRVGVPRTWFFENVHPDVLRATDDALGTFADLGAEVREVTVPHADLAASIGLFLFLAESADYHRARLTSAPQLFDEDARGFLEIGALLPAAAYVRALRAQSMVVRGAEELLGTAGAPGEVDVLVTPTMPCLPAPYGAGAFDLVDIGGPEMTLAGAHVRNTLYADVAGLPAGTAMSGLDREGLPIGLQVMARRGADDLVLRVLAAHEETRGFLPAPVAAASAEVPR